MGVKKSSLKAFTIVELLVVIVVIGILATITIVSYTGITKKAVASSLQSSLKEVASKIDVDFSNTGAYPTTSAGIDGGKGFPITSNVTYAYNLTNNGTGYCVSATSTTQTSLIFHYTSEIGQVETGACPAVKTCPTGFIVVPGSTTYNTLDFCVMKYEAKNVAGVATSQADGTPWVSISQTDATTASSAACSGCHLITEAEWMTIAQNVLGVASNWSGGAVGNGYIYSGHNDNTPANSIAASTDNNDGYNGTGNSSASGANQRRTLTLSNGEVIWDLAGNVFEWTAGQTNGTTAQQPGVAGNAYSSYVEWPNITTSGTLSPNVFPSGTGLSGAGSWTSSNGIGELSSNPADTSLHGFIRGGNWINGSTVGVLTLGLNYGPSYTNGTIGFRVSR
jgi:prepilin-type N-terminal cleavage/methylation domain-containing protein